MADRQEYAWMDIDARDALTRNAIPFREGDGDVTVAWPEGTATFTSTKSGYDHGLTVYRLPDTTCLKVEVYPRAKLLRAYSE